MISLILGFASSVVPKVFDLFKDHSDKKQELALLDRQLELQKMVAAEKTAQVQYESQSANYQSDNELMMSAINQQTEMVRNAHTWVADINALVRPVFAFSAIYFLHVIVWGSLSNDPAAAERAAKLLAAPLIIEFVLYVIGFWLGNRSFGKK